MDEHDVFVAVMAGGSGTRFWPLSRSNRPKQLLPLAGGDESLLRATFHRLREVCPPERFLIVTSELLADATARDLPELPRENILAEPVGRNTAPCVAWAASVVRRRTPNAVLVLVPADHHIGDPATYVGAIRRAISAARTGALVTIGVRPTRPETGYGYIEVGAEVAEEVHEAKRFVEKPDAARAQQFLAAGTFLWNSGMFFFRADAVMAEFEKQLPDVAQGMRTLDAAAKTGDEAAALAKLYPTLTSISIDHGIMEKAARVQVVPASFGWSDLGSWTTAWELAPKDARGNAIAGGAEGVIVDAERTYVFGGRGKTVAVVGVSDLVVVETEDAILVLPRERAQDVRAVVDELKKRGRTERL